MSHHQGQSTDVRTIRGKKLVTLPQQPPTTSSYDIHCCPTIRGKKPVTLPQQPPTISSYDIHWCPTIRGKKPVTLPQQPQSLPMIFTGVPPSGAKPVTHDSRKDCGVNTADEKTSEMGINGCMVWCQGNLSVKMATPAVALPRLHDPALSVVQHPPSGDCLTYFIANRKRPIYHANHARIINQLLFGCFVCFAPLFSVTTTLFECFICFAALFSLTTTTTTVVAAAAAAAATTTTLYYYYYYYYIVLSSFFFFFFLFSLSLFKRTLMLLTCFFGIV